jgi:hypothetical protein
VTRRALVLLVPVVIIAALAALGLARRPRRAESIELVVTPPATEVSVRVGDAVGFSVATAAPADVTWSLWSRPVSHERTWAYVPGPGDAGWQHVTLTVVGPRGSRVERMWDVGVVPALAPTLLEVLPPPGAMTVAAGEQPRFRCGARAAAARPGDRLHFDWTLDDRPVHRDVGPAATAFSELVLPASDAGPHRLAVRVGEGDGDGDGVASRAEWTVEVATPAPVAPPPPSPPPATLVEPSGPRRLTGVVGERFAFTAEVTPEPPRTRYDWAVDGRRAQRGPAPRFEYAAAAAGRHRIIVAVTAGRKSIKRDGWLLVVAPPR